MPRTSKEMIKFLEANGFVAIGQNGSHRKFYNKNTNKTVIVPYHNKTLKIGTEKNILRQAGLN